MSYLNTKSFTVQTYMYVASHQSSHMPLEGVQFDSGYLFQLVLLEPVPEDPAFHCGSTPDAIVGTEYRPMTSKTALPVSICIHPFLYFSSHSYFGYQPFWFIHPLLFFRICPADLWKENNSIG